MLFSSFQHSEQADITLLKYVHRVRCPGYNSDPRIPNKTQNFFLEIASTVSYPLTRPHLRRQIAQDVEFIEIGQEYDAEILMESFRIDTGL
jgi:hypothetical protein